MVKRKKNEQKQRQTRDEPGKTEIRESLYTEFSVERTHQPGPRFLFFIWCPVLYYSSMQTPHVGNHQQKKTIGAYQQPKPRPTWGATPRPARRAVSKANSTAFPTPVYNGRRKQVQLICALREITI